MKIAVLILLGLTFAALPVLLFAVLFALAVHYLLSKLRWEFNP